MPGICRRILRAKIGILLFALLFSSVAFFVGVPDCFAENPGSDSNRSASISVQSDQVMMAGFEVREEAEQFMKRLEQRGFRTILKTEGTGDRLLHAVYAVAEGPENAASGQDSGPAGIRPESPRNGTTDMAVHSEQILMGSFQVRQEAENFMKKLEESGYRTLLKTVGSGDDQTHNVYVFVEDPNGLLSEAGAISGQTLNGTAAAKNGSYEKPSWDILGKKKRYLHGSLSLSGIYTDNVLNSRNNKQSDFSTYFAPALWLTYPNTNQNVAPFDLSLRSPGGYLLGKDWPDSLFRYQATLYYRPVIPLTSSSGFLRTGKAPSHTVVGSLRLQGNRFSLSLEDQLDLAQQELEPGGITVPGSEGRYDSNYFAASIHYETRNRIVLGAGYSHFAVRHKAETDQFRDRQDHGFFASLSYKLSPRLRLVAEYRFFDILYDFADLRNSREQYLMGGFTWDISAKTTGRLMAGYAVKDMEGPGRPNRDAVVEAEIHYRLSPKTSLAARAYRKKNESDLQGMAFSVTTGFDLELRHTLSRRLTGSAYFLYANQQYQDWLLRKSVETSTYQLRAALEYEFRKWLRGTAGYAYSWKTASIPELEFNNTTMFFNIMTSF